MPRPPLDALRALFVALPAIVLALPGGLSPIAGAPHPELDGAAWVALATAPLAVWALFARRSAGSAKILWLVAFAVAGEISLAVWPPSDTLEADRALLLVTSGAVLCVGGSQLGAVGRTWLVRIALGIALLHLGAAFTGAREGLTGNTGATAAAASVGALAGARLAVGGGGLARLLGAVALLAFTVYAGWAPVLAGELAFAAVVGFSVVLARGEGRPRRGFVVVAILGSLAFGAARALDSADRLMSGETSTEEVVAMPLTGEGGGLAVRRHLWASTASLVADHPLLGVGPGQFRAAFPPYRAPEEIELSTHGRRLDGVVTEVGHAHSDPLQGLAEAGWLGGVAWLLFLALAFFRALGAMRSEDVERAALGCGVLALLVHAAVRTPLTFDPASSALGFGAIGALFAPWREDGGDAPRGVLPKVTMWLALLAFALHVPDVQGIAGHGRALRRALAGDGDPTTLLRGALAFREDSVPAHAALARGKTRDALAAPRPEPRLALAAWERVLERRPHHLEARASIGRLHAAAGEADEARSAWRRALALDPGSPQLRRNLGLVELRAGRHGAALGWIDDLEATGHLPEGLVDAWALEALQRLDAGSGLALLARSDPRFAGAAAETMHALGSELEAGAEADELRRRIGRSLVGLAHLDWARDQAAAGDYVIAVRSYRQARSHLARTSAGGATTVPAPLALELAGALVLTERRDEAERTLDGLDPSARELADLPPWAGQALLDAGLLR